MAGEEGSSKARTTRSATKRAAKAAVSGGQEYVLTRCHHVPMEKSALRPCTTKRKAEESVCTTKRKAEESVCTTKRKAAAIGCSELKAAKGDEEKAPAKKKSRLPQEDVDYILSRVRKLPRFIDELKLQNPDLMPSPEEALDEEMVELYEEARLFSNSADDFGKFQAWVRSEYRKKGYVELDNDFLAKVEKAKASMEEFKKELARDLADDL